MAFQRRRPVVRPSPWAPIISTILPMVAVTLLIVISVSNQHELDSPPMANAESAAWMKTLPRVRTFDGTHNSPTGAGAANTPLGRLLPERCNAEARPPIAQVMRLFDPAQNNYTAPRTRLLSAMAFLWGQFVDHTLVLTGANVTVNALSSFLDGSTVYGTTEEEEAELRDPEDRALMRLNNTLLPGWPRMHAGDVRRDEHAALLAVHTLFVREHNRLAEQFRAKGDERAFDMARRRVMALLQYITVEEWFPAVFGRSIGSLAYDMYTDPSVTHEFASVCFRFGHSMVTQRIGDLDLVESFMHSNEYLRENGIDALLAATATEPAMAVDLQVVDAMRTTPGFNLPEANVERGRERCAPSYADMLEHYYLPVPSSWDEVVGRNATGSSLAPLLAEIYGSNPAAPTVDAFAGMLAEGHYTGAATGSLVLRCVREQLRALVRGDAFYYLWMPLPEWDSSRAAIVETLAPLGAVIARNTVGNDALRTPLGGSIFYEQNS